MKKITKPATKEEAVYYSDFSGKMFDEYGVHAELTLNFNYGSNYDSARINLHLTDKEAEEVLEFIKQRISKDCVASLKEKLHNKQINYDEAVDFRDWSSCELITKETDLIKKLIE